jgi:hypothetical protein
MVNPAPHTKFLTVPARAGEIGSHRIKNTDHFGAFTVMVQR